MTPQPVSEIKMVFRKSIMDWLLANISKPPKQRKPLDTKVIIFTVLKHRQPTTGLSDAEIAGHVVEIAAKYERVKSALAQGKHRPMSEDESIEFLERQITKAEADETGSREATV